MQPSKCKQVFALTLGVHRISQFCKIVGRDGQQLRIDSSEKSCRTMATTFIEEGNRLLPRIVLIACGSFSPPTPMHFRLFEIARDYFELGGTHEVVGGVMSPTHDAYGKKGLTQGIHRYAMLKLALQSSSWIRVSDWELLQSQWSRTQTVLQYHQNYINNYINSPGLEDLNGPLPGWLPSLERQRRDRIQLRLLCGADLLESFAVPGLWADEDIEDIVANHGLVVISRSGANPEKFIFESDILTKYKRNISLITNWVPNEVSSTMIRRLLSRGESVKYLIDETVLAYIKKHGLFNYRSFNLDNRPPKVFCCGETEANSVASKLPRLSNRASPGQAVQVITNERGTTTRTSLCGSDEDATQPKKFKSSSDV